MHECLFGVILSFSIKSFTISTFDSSTAMNKGVLRNYNYKYSY